MADHIEDERRLVANNNLSSRDPDEETNKERREQIRHLQKEAFQLANYYFVFQGIIFTAFYNAPSSLKCRYHWIPFALSFLAGFLNLCALSSIALKYKFTLDAIDRNAIRMYGNLTQPRGSGGDNEPIVVKCERHWRMFYVIGCMTLFLGFFVITLIGCWKITCSETPDVAPSQSPVKAL